MAFAKKYTSFEAVIPNWLSFLANQIERGRSSKAVFDSPLTMNGYMIDFLDALLRRRSEAGRLKELNHYLTQYVPRQRTIERVKQAAPTNGFGGRPAGL